MTLFELNGSNLITTVNFVVIGGNYVLEKLYISTSAFMSSSGVSSFSQLFGAEWVVFCFFIRSQRELLIALR